MDARSAIGVFDSGSGGLTVLAALERAFPHENFVYYADTANLPYGGKTPSQILALSQHIVSFFEHRVHAKMVIAACHTSSALALEHIHSAIPLVGTIFPLIDTLRALQPAHIGLIATQASIDSQNHVRIFRQHGLKGRITPIACPAFVPLIEAPTWDEAAILAACKTSLSPLKDCDALIYGCTHYPLIEGAIKAHLPQTPHFVDAADSIVTTVDRMLHAEHLANPQKLRGTTQFVCSGSRLQLEQKLRTFQAKLTSDRANTWVATSKS